MRARMLIKAPPPPVVPEESPHYFKIIKDFAAVNTQADRTAIKDEQFAWLENMIPVGFGNLQVVPTFSDLSQGWSQPANQLFSCALYNPNSPPLFPATLDDFLVCFQTDGSAEYFDLSTNVKGSIGGAGTFTTLAGMPVGTNIQVAQYKNDMLHILDPVKGLFVWVPQQTVVHVGSIGIIAVTAGGTGYTSPPNVIIGAPVDANGIQATAFATVTAGVVTSITVLNAGTGYTGASPSITVSGGGGTGATAVCSLITFAMFTVSAVLITNGGSGYATPPAVSFAGGVGGGSGAAGTALISGGAVVAVIITNAGSGYHGGATVGFSGGGGSGAAGNVTLQLNPNVAVATFAGRVWVAQGRTVSYSAAGIYSYSDFITVSAGSIIITDSTLHGNIVQLISANNFLYVFGADSVNVFSDVNVTSTGTTLFTNTTVSSSIGTFFPQGILNYFRSVLFMNQYGIYALVGATASKISDALDGVFKYIDFTAPITCGQVVVNNQLCACFSFRYNDPLSSSRVIQAMYFEKKWWFASQGITATRVVSANTAGNLVMYATNSTNIEQLFVNTTSTLTWLLRTALWPMEDVMRTKQALRFAVELRTGAQGVIMIATVDNENGSSAPVTLYNAAQWLNNDGNIITWVNNLNQTVDWLLTGYELYQKDAQQYGKYLGLTLSGTAPGAIITGTQLEYTINELFK